MFSRTVIGGNVPWPRNNKRLSITMELLRLFCDLLCFPAPKRSPQSPGKRYAPTSSGAAACSPLAVLRRFGHIPGDVGEAQTRRQVVGLVREGIRCTDIQKELNILILLLLLFSLTWTNRNGKLLVVTTQLGKLHKKTHAKNRYPMPGTRPSNKFTKTKRKPTAQRCGP